MFQEPKKYTDNDHFFFEPDHDLEKVCNAPKDKDGVFKVLELRNGKINLVYIGYSNSGGIFNEIVNGVHHDKNPRKIGWTYRSEEHTSELQSRPHLVCRLLLEKKKNKIKNVYLQ